VRDLAGLRPALQRAFDSGVAAVVNVETDPAVLSELLRAMVGMGIM